MLAALTAQFPGGDAEPITGKDGSVSWYGAALLARYQISEVFAAGVRGEIIRDANGRITAPSAGPLTLMTGTLTLEAAPSKHLLIRMDNRIDAADNVAWWASNNIAFVTYIPFA